MKKKNYSKGEEWKSFQETFEKECKARNYDPKNYDAVKFVHELIDECAELQHDICSSADVVNIDMFKQAQELTQVDECKINKNTWNEFINKAIILQKKAISDKALEKAENKAKEMEYIGQLRMAVNKSLSEGSDDVNIISEIKSGLEDDNKKKSSDFMKLLNDAANIRIGIRSLYKRYYACSRVFQYIVEGRYTHVEFKQMVDSVAYGFNEKNQYGEHHVDNAVRFCKTFRCMNEFGFVQFENIVAQHGVKCSVMHENENEEIA